VLSAGVGTPSAAKAAQAKTQKATVKTVLIMKTPIVYVQRTIRGTRSL
jgi:hypothetical protein